MSDGCCFVPGSEDGNPERKENRTEKPVTSGSVQYRAALSYAFGMLMVNEFGDFPEERKRLAEKMEQENITREADAEITETLNDPSGWLSGITLILQVLSPEEPFRTLLESALDFLKNPGCSPETESSYGMTAVEIGRTVWREAYKGLSRERKTVAEDPRTSSEKISGNR